MKEFYFAQHTQVQAGGDSSSEYQYVKNLVEPDGNYSVIMFLFHVFTCFFLRSFFNNYYLDKNNNL